MRVLITGGFGYLGGRLAQYLSQQVNWEIVLGSRQKRESPQWLPKASICHMDWNSCEELEQACYGIDVIVHAAGMSARNCSENPVLAVAVNALCSVRLLDAAIKQKVKRFIYISTAHVYSEFLSGYIDEEVYPSNLHPYATSHRAAEDIVLYAHKCQKIEGVVVRLSNAFGTPVEKESSCWSLLINNLCLQAVKNHQLILRSSGTERRNFISMLDTCRAISHLLAMPSGSLLNGIFNVGSYFNKTVFEVAQYVSCRTKILMDLEPNILVSSNGSSKKINFFEYGIKKLESTGFKIHTNSSVDQEIDALLKFCETLP